jgi:predicted SnoaL-like aldol condensation-catalyzing enzyme
MKKYLLLVSMASSLFFISCSDKGGAGTSEKAKKNLETNHAIMKMFQSGDWSKVDQYLDKDAVDHGASMTGGDVVGIDSIKANFAMMTQMMSNLEYKVVKELADDDYVMSWMEQSATSNVDSPEWGMKKGQRNTYNSIEVSKFKDGKVTDHWSFMSMADMMKMMGGGNMDNMQPTVKDTVAPVTPKDTTSK